MTKKKPLLLLQLRNRVRKHGFKTEWLGNTLRIDHEFYGWAQISQNGNYVSFWRGTYLLNVTFELYAPNILILEKKVYERLIVQKQFKSVAMQKLLEYQHPPERSKVYKTFIENGEKKIRAVYL